MFAPGQNQLLANLSLLLFLRIFRSFVFMILKRTFEECVSLFSYQRSFFCFAVCLKQLRYYIMLFSACQEVFQLFWSCFCFSLAATLVVYHTYHLVVKNFFFATFRFSPNGEGGIWTLAPLLTTYSLSRGAPSATWVLLQMSDQKISFFFYNGEGGIRTHAPFRTNGFQDRLVMTTSIPLHIYNSENRLIELPLCNVRYDITCTFPMSRPYFIFYRFFCFFP